MELESRRIEAKLRRGG